MRFENLPAQIDEIEADMSFSFVLLKFGPPRQLNCLAGYFLLGSLGVPGNFFDRMPAEITAQKIHARVNPGRIFPQDCFNLTGALEDLLPV